MERIESVKRKTNTKPSLYGKALKIYRLNVENRISENELSHKLRAWDIAVIFGCERETIAQKKGQKPRMFFSNNFYCTQTKLQKGNDFTPVCDSVHGGGDSVHPRTNDPLGRHPFPPRETDTPWQTSPSLHPLGRYPLCIPACIGEDTPPPCITTPRRPLQRMVLILLECILVR